MAKAVLSEATLAHRSSTVAVETREIWPTKVVTADASAQSEGCAVGQSIDPRLFTELFRRYASYVLHALPYLGVAESDIEDVCQDVFTTVYQNYAKFQGRSSVRTWIYGICLNKVLNYRRAAHRRRERLDPTSSESEVESNQLNELEQKRARHILQQALAELSADKREVFVLYEIEELSMSEVAQTLSCPLFTAYSRLYAARRDMKATVERLIVDQRDATRST